MVSEKEKKTGDNTTWMLFLWSRKLRYWNITIYQFRFRAHRVWSLLHRTRTFCCWFDPTIGRELRLLLGSEPMENRGKFGYLWTWEWRRLHNEELHRSTRYFIIWNQVMITLLKVFKTLKGYKNMSKGRSFTFISLFPIRIFTVFLDPFPWKI